MRDERRMPECPFLLRLGFCLLLCLQLVEVISNRGNVAISRPRWPARLGGQGNAVASDPPLGWWAGEWLVANDDRNKSEAGASESARGVRIWIEKTPEVSRLESGSGLCFVWVAGNSNRGVPIRISAAGEK